MYRLSVFIAFCNMPGIEFWNLSQSAQLYTRFITKKICDFAFGHFLVQDF